MNDTGLGGGSGVDDLLARLHAGSPQDRGSILDDLISAHPESRLVVPGEAETRPNLRGVLLSKARLRGAALSFSDLHDADLSDANLAQARLAFAGLEGADLRRADLTEADLHGAGLGEADLRSALLEDAHLDDANLRFADLRGAVLENASLNNADFWGARLAGCEMHKASARGARFGEVQAVGVDLRGADLRDADFTQADLTAANLEGADLRGANCKGAILNAADLSGAALQGIDLTQSRVSGVFWSGALLDHTRLSREQIGRVGEELAGRPAKAAGAYLVLERNFTELGDTPAASWAYLRRRRMQKNAAWAGARESLSARRPGAALAHAALFLGDQAVEWMCDYGESLLRVFAAILVVYLGFTVLYGLIGGVDRVSTTAGAATTAVTRAPLDLLVFSLMAMTTSGTASSVLVGSNLYIALLTGAEALTGIFLTGLLGFVAGNRIRR